MLKMIIILNNLRIMLLSRLVGRFGQASELFVDKTVDIVD
jgi:hypothetical protein